MSHLGPDGRYRTRPLTRADLRSLQQLFEAGHDYFEITTGQQPGSDEAQRALVAGPPTKAVDDKRTVGVFGPGDELVGIIDAISDWPDERVWTVGMLLLAPGHRGAGLGSSVLRAFEDWATDEGARLLRTAIVRRHAAGAGFLKRMGYSAVRDDEGPVSGVPVVHFQKQLDATG